MRRWIFALVGMCMFTAATAQAQNVTTTLSSRVWSKYLINPGFVLHENPVIQTDLLITLPHGLYVDVWGSKSLDGSLSSSDFGNEIDYTVGWAKKLGNVSLDFGLAYFDISKLFGSPKGDVIQIFGQIDQSFKVAQMHAVTPFLRLEFSARPFGTGASPSENIQALMGMKHVWDIGPVLSLKQTGQLIYDQGKFFNEAAGIFQYQLNPVWNLSKHLSVEIPNFKLSTPLTHTRGRGLETAVGAGAVYKF